MVATPVAWYRYQVSQWWRHRVVVPSRNAAHVHMGVARVELTPHNQYLLFWREIQTSEAMLAIATALGHEWSFPRGKTEMTIRYGYAKLNQPSTATEGSRLV
jgi:hypothetical protein